MATPIKLTPEIKKEIMKKIAAEIDKSLMFNGEFSYKTAYEYKNVEKANIVFDPVAYIKMCAIVDQVSSEVAWNGTVTRVDDNTFYITDIMVYPQTVTNVTVTVDEMEYAEWQDETFKTDEEFMSCRFQGHSHVNMSPTPSGVDLDTRENILKNIGSNDFYIFMIINKAKEFTACIYDMKNNIYYSNDDIDIYIDDFNYKKFVEDSKKMVKTATYSTAAKTTGKVTTLPKTTTTTTASTSQTKTYPKYYNYYNYKYEDDEDCMLGWDDDEVDEFTETFGEKWWEKFGYSSKQEYFREN